MDISLDVVQELAPDQTSLNAAKKLLNPTKWPLRGKAVAVNSIWGQCQGSGANPYYTMADVVDHGYKCTCPSRKFPCKHVLALMWQFAEGASDFSESEPPEWVHDWLGRRRKSAATDTTVDVTSDNHSLKKDIGAAQVEVKEISSPEEIAKKEAANVKRATQTKSKTNASINTGLQEFQQWIDDQLRTGIAAFIKDINERCRRIAARLVDAKAASLASRIDEFPAKLMALPADQQASMAFKELGQLVLLSEAWLANNEDIDARRAIATVENREQLSASKKASSQSGNWQNVGEKVLTRRDGLVSHATWLVNTDLESAKFALLLDHYPASAGRRIVALNVGSQMKGEIVYYPSRSPSRGFLIEHQVQEKSHSIPWPVSSMNVYSAYAQHLAFLPWAEEIPHILPLGRILQDTKELYYWQDHDAQQSLPLSNSELPALLLGDTLSAAFILYNGDSAELLSAQSARWGVIVC